MQLKNKVALISGGTSGIGRATAELFATQGARVAITGRRAKLGRQMAEAVDGVFIQADHRRLQDCERSVRETMAAFGRIDILFNNAGIVLSGTAEGTSEQDWEDILLLNVTAVWRMSRLVIPVLRAQGGGVIVNNASDWAMVGAPSAVAYCTTKGAVVQMTRAMALDHAAENIRINAVCPGDTFVERWLKEGYYRQSGGVSEEEARKSDLPIGRVAEAAEIARAVLFLATEASSFMTGATLVVDGGNTAR
ncbi:MAG: SDR family oxidoreductase [Anaerolineales bacterium]|nr:SDR family oxidoreductase [Anaerolineales bacterium]